MATLALRSLAVAAVLGVGGALGSGCVVEEVPPPVYADGYEPAFYEGYLVYYDDFGRPYYYRSGVSLWVSPASPAYPRLAAHWRLYRPWYRPWYVHHGYRYRGYHWR
jgi:hypothetical protein